MKLRSYLLANTLEHFQSEDVNRCWAEWRDWFFKAVDQFIPTRTIKDVNSPPWIDGEVRHLIRKKYSDLRKYRQCRSEHRRSKLRELSQAVKNLIKTKHCQYLHKIIHSFCHNSKLFWSYHKAIFHHRSTPCHFPQRHSCNNTPPKSRALPHIFRFCLPNLNTKTVLSFRCNTLKNRLTTVGDDAQRGRYFKLPG